MIKIKEEDKQIIFSLFEQGLSASEIAKKLPYSHDCVWSTLKNNGYDTSRRNVRCMSQKIKQEIAELYASKVPTSIILKKYPYIKSQNTIVKIAKAQGCKIRRPGNATHIEHEDFFSVINSEEKAYLLGLLVADGSVIYPNSKTPKNPFWTITLHDKDRYILEWIQSIVGITTKISHSRNESIISVRSKIMVNDLAKYGIVPRKSFTTYYPNGIPSHLNRHFIRGVFDGDGCITNGHVVGFYGNAEFILAIQEKLIQDISINKTKLTKRDVNGADSFNFSSKKDVKAFYHYLYDESTIWLRRKREKFELLSFIKDANTVVTK